ncbi:chaperonin 10-like protein [Dactylonectria macrodidyma]|uniref:Chaperonin 10-like protein n=1 Tax=Dactylonectria macrodidyma TaxID=307937 RepID=A0A9P9FIW8_9HYPO|nr:chaperonin 10-like protein [Dactylonectria macrodidyma]
MRGLVLTPETKSVSLQDVPTPTPGPTQILVRVRAVALNIVDPLYVVMPMATQNRVIGSDFAGEVTQVGEGLSGLDDARAKVGAHVAGFLQGAGSANDRPGAFAEYLVIDYDLAWSVPASLSLEQASTINLCGLTAAQGVFARLQLPCPFYKTEGFQDLDLNSSEPVNILVYGATSSVGLYAAQLIKIAEQTSGRKIRLIGAASASKHALLRAAPYHYDVLVDYRDSSWTEKVREATRDSSGVHYAVDAISIGPTIGQVESTLVPKGKFVAYRSPEAGNFDLAALKIKPIIGAVWEGLGEEIVYHGGVTIPADPEARKFAVEYYNFLGSGRESDKVLLQPNPTRQMPGGLESIIPEGFTLIGPTKVEQSGESQKVHLRPVSGEKIVYSI